jgi:hypothetical protein
MAAKVTGGNTSFQSLTKGLPKVREGEINAWRAATGVARSHRPTMKDIAAFRKSDALSPVGQMHARFAQNVAFETPWQQATRTIRPALGVGSAMETLNRLNRPLVGVAEALERRTRPFREAAEILDRRVSAFKEPFDALEKKISAFSGAMETLDRLARPLGGVYYPPRPDFRPYNPRPTPEAPPEESEAESGVGEILPGVDLSGTLSTYPEGTFLWWIDRHHRVIVVFLTAGGLVVTTMTLAATVIMLYLTHQST